MASARYQSLAERFSLWKQQAELTFKAFKSNRISMTGFAVIVAAALLAISSPIIASQHPSYVFVGGTEQQRWGITLSSVLLSPSLIHPFGTDELGRDIFSRVLYGAQLDLILPLEVVIFSAVIGIVIGGIGGYFERFIGEALMRFTDVFLAVPSIILALALVAALGASLNHIVIAMIATWWAWYSRLVYGETRKIKHRDFVDVARSSGLSGTAIFFRHILQNVLAPAIIQATSDMGTAILAIAGLSFLGLGAPPGTAEWGLMISESENYIFSAWWYPVFPGIAIIVTVMAFNLLGDGLRDVLDPTARTWQSQISEKKAMPKEAKKPDEVPLGTSLLSVRDLSVDYHSYEGTVQAVRNVSFDIHEGEAYGLIGESGSGKSTVAYDVIGLLPRPPAETVSGRILLKTKHADMSHSFVDMLTLREEELNQIRGKKIAMIFQDVLDSLQPSYRISFQMCQTYLLHQFDMLLEIAANEVRGAYRERECVKCGAKVETDSWICSKCLAIVDPRDEDRWSFDEEVEKTLNYSERRELLRYFGLYKNYKKARIGPDSPPDKRLDRICRKLVIRDLQRVTVPAPEKTVDLYPFELSGGMRQRVVIAMMMACNPGLLIADEPTTALDVVSERNILDVIKEFKTSLGISILLISHDLNVIRRFCDRVAVMYAGRIVEEGPLNEVFKNPLHPYTDGLMRSRPVIQEDGQFVKRGNLHVLAGVVPDLKNPPPGCLFADRCQYASEICRKQIPELLPLNPGHLAACYHPLGQSKP
ncbi:MAG: dipeptide/oligopeptide/nickel ABC transporter permease/ATP-binding protein [Candidatus Bathyarchaeia archaeon]